VGRGCSRGCALLDLTAQQRRSEVTLRETMVVGHARGVNSLARDAGAAILALPFTAAAVPRGAHFPATLVEFWGMRPGTSQALVRAYDLGEHGEHETRLAVLAAHVGIRHRPA
jgi:hypothetical protein